MIHSSIPIGLCQCGCGLETRIARQDNPTYGHIKGHPLRFILNHSQTPPTLEEKFWQHVYPDDINQCWEWQGGLHQGYGRFTYRGEEHLAHRVSYEIKYGTAPEGKFICHECDNPACANWYHLFVGTSPENFEDMRLKGRQAKGIRNGNSKLSEEDIIAIRKMYANGLLQKDLASLFKVSQGAVSSIIRRDSWRHIP